jgi:asparagine synthase (glutamine-hydrolysing)
MKEIGRLGELLDSAVSSCCDKEVGSIFSSGLDSALVTFLASRHCKVAAYTVGAIDSEDYKFSTKSKEVFDFPIKLIEIDEKKVEEILPELVKIVGNPDPLKVSVGVPMYFAAEAAKKDGLKRVLSGQGGDELFGGYNRYLAHAVKNDYASLKKSMDSDVRSAYSDNLDRDTAVFKAFGIELCFPYMDKAFGDYAMSLPYELKVCEVMGGETEFACLDELDGRKFIRKYLQRRLARSLGLPEFIIGRKKKAAQYGSSSEKLINKLAKEHNFKKKAEDAGRQDYVRMYLESLISKSE